MNNHVSRRDFLRQGGNILGARMALANLGPAVAVNPNSAAVNATSWIEWEIPLSRLAGVDLAQVKKMYIGVGDRETPVPDGTGRIYIDDIRVLKP